MGEHRCPLHMAVMMGDSTIVSLLLNAGANVDLPDAQHKTSLHLAIEEKDPTMIDLLLDNKADLNLGNVRSGMNNSPLMDAAHVQDLQLVRKFLSAKADVNQQGKQDVSIAFGSTER